MYFSWLCHIALSSYRFPVTLRSHCLCVESPQTRKAQGPSINWSCVHSDAQFMKTIPVLYSMLLCITCIAQSWFDVPSTFHTKVLHPITLIGRYELCELLLECTTLHTIHHPHSCICMVPCCISEM